MASYYIADTHIRFHTPVATRARAHTHTHTHTHTASYYHADTHEGLTLAFLWPHTCIRIHTQPHIPLVTHTQGHTFLWSHTHTHTHKQHTHAHPHTHTHKQHTYTPHTHSKNAVATPTHKASQLDVTSLGPVTLRGVQQSHVVSTPDGHNMAGVVVDHAGNGFKGLAVLAQNVAHAAVWLAALVDLDVDGLASTSATAAR